MYPKISIVTPSFNQGQYIEQTIQSVLNQNYPNLEYIIIDGGSTDETVEIIKRYEQHITYWVSVKDKGQTDAINKGFAKCTGEIFNWLNSDDYYEPNTLHRVGQAFKDNDNIRVVCGKEWGFKDDNPNDRVLHAGSIIKENVYQSILTGVIDQPCTFFSKSPIEPFFPLDISLCYVMDRQLWWSYLLKFGQDYILQTEDVLTNFRLHSISKSVAYADLFEAEFDRLKGSLLKQLKAPQVLLNQFEEGIKPLNRYWDIKIEEQKIIAAFAGYYATCSYVKDDWQATKQLIKLVKKYKGEPLSKTEWKQWFSTNVLSEKSLQFFKGIKAKI